MTVGRNDRCPCGSGKKHKACCLLHAEPMTAGSNAPLPPATVRQLVALATAKNYPQMEAVSRELTAAYPQSGFVWKALSVAQQTQGKDALHALETAARLLPLDPEPHSNLGAALRQRGRMEEAVLCYRRALEIQPDIAEVWNNLGNALHDCGHLDDSAAAFRRALELRPDFVGSLNNLGNALKNSGHLDAAVDSYHRALLADPNCLEAHVNLGSILRLQARPVDAEHSCRRALEIDPHFIPGILLLADIHADRGRFAEAEAEYRRASVLLPNSTEAWAGLVGLKRMSAADSDWLIGARRILAEPLSPDREMPLQYALGKYCDDVGDHAEAMAHYRRANALARRARPRHDRCQVTEGIDRIIQIYDRDWLNGIRADTDVNARACDSERAVFIVGMPRSGTSLAEQILASHAVGFGGGELPFWNTAVTRHAAVGRDAIAAPQLKVLADEYLTGLSDLSADAHRVVDKMPGNFLYLGLIHAALPKARLIHLRRNPLDTCLSIYFQNFSAVHSYANDLADLAHYYAAYRRIMDHWRRVLPPDVLLEVDYEELVTAPEVTSRTMTDFIGLPWDPGCLEFHRNPRTVSTFSKWQARQPISPGAVGRWRHYASFIAPLLPLAR